MRVNDVCIPVNIDGGSVITDVACSKTVNRISHNECKPGVNMCMHETLGPMVAEEHFDNHRLAPRPVSTGDKARIR